MIAEELWTELERQRTAVPGLVRRRVGESTGRNLFLAVSHPALTRMLILAVEPAAATAVTEALETRALHTDVVPTDRGLVEIRVTLTAPEMARVFTPFVDDVLDSVGVAASDAEAVEAFLTRFLHWRRLLASTQPEGLGPQQAQGLYGELWVLRHILLDALGAPAAVQAWKAPEREDRDFASGNVAVEVKTTVRDNPLTVAISGERQLDLAAFSRLFLVALAIDGLRAGGGQTLNALVDDIMTAVASENDTLLLRDKLLDYGYASPHRPRYEAVRYSLRQVSVYEVRDGFPRILETDLQPGVGHVGYHLALPACEPWRSSVEELQHVLGASVT